VTKATKPNRGTSQKQTKPTAIPSGLKSSPNAALKGDPRSGKSGVAGGGSNAGSKRAPGLYDVTGSSIGLSGRGTGTGKGKSSYKKS